MMRSILSVLMLAAVAACSDAIAPVQPPAATYVKLSLARASSVTPRVAGLAFDLGPNDSVNPGASLQVLLAATEVSAGTQGAMRLTAAMPTVVGIKQDGVLIDPLSFTPGDTVPYLWTAPTTVGQHTLVGDYVDASGAHQTVGTITIAVRDTTTPVDTTWTITAAWDTAAFPAMYSVYRTRAGGGTDVVSVAQLSPEVIPVLHMHLDGVPVRSYRLDSPYAVAWDSLPAGCVAYDPTLQCDAGTFGRLVVTVAPTPGSWWSFADPVLGTVHPQFAGMVPGATAGIWFISVGSYDSMPSIPPCTRCE